MIIKVIEPPLSVSVNDFIDDMTQDLMAVVNNLESVLDETEIIQKWVNIFKEVISKAETSDNYRQIIISVDEKIVFYSCFKLINSETGQYNAELALIRNSAAGDKKFMREFAFLDLLFNAAIDKGMKIVNSRCKTGSQLDMYYDSIHALGLSLITDWSRQNSSLGWADYTTKLERGN